MPGMSGLAYLLLPVSGALAFVLGRDPRLRFHGLQAIVLGLLWPLALYGGSAVSPATSRIVFFAGAVVWFGFAIAAAVGRDPKLPLVWERLQRLAQEDLRAEA